MKKFIVLSSQRSGSVLLEYLLNSHGNIFCDNEIFNENEDHIIKNGKFSREYLHIRKLDPIKYLNLFFDINMDDEITHIGFRFFYNHAKKPDERVVWDHLKSMKDLLVIHLKRLHLLESYLSLQLAKQSKNWLRKAGEPAVNYSPLHLDFQETLAYFKKKEKDFTKMKSFFKDHAMLEVTYEDLVTRQNETTTAILNHLELEPKELTTSTKKQNTKKPSDLISNYKELKKRFTKTAWEQLFVE